MAVQVPVTFRDPVTGTVLQPRLARETSMSPDKVRHDDVTVQVPTMEPPHGVAVGQLPPEAPPDPPFGEPPVPVLPPVPEPPEPVPVPPLPLFPPELLLPPLPPPLPPALLQPVIEMAEAKLAPRARPTRRVRMERTEATVGTGRFV